MKTVEKLDQSKNGVKVTVYVHYENGERVGRTVDYDCQCYGIKFRAHSNEYCPLRK